MQAPAQLMDPITVDYSSMILADHSMYWSGEQLEESINERTSRRGKRGDSTDNRAPLSTTFAPGSAHSTIEKLVAVYPVSHRTSARATFQAMLSGYEQVAGKFALPKNDLAGAVAAFIAGNYMAYRGVEFPDAYFVPLVDQVRSIILKNPQFAAASPGAKQAAYEQLAIIGMMMATTQMALKQQPQAELAAKLQAASGRYLEQFLSTDANRVQITSQGLVLR